ncbi:hydrocephalus-inducing protein homolog isoform X2 [Clinocottus analis]|uniref:hydrocephalus-inducing protein homolog isoform X2 n=1 Tax=Clinocottus analis TaxID=304258 RepID=UPI0035BEED7D
MAAIQFPSRTYLGKSEVPLKPKRVTPSAYTQEMLQPTEERLANTDNMRPPHILEHLDMSTTTHHKSLFGPYPSELVFQNFTPAQTYTLPLLFHNRDKVPRKVKVEHQESEYFHVVGPEDARSRVAPGLSTAFTVFFAPQENRDYHYRLVCVTDRERFEVPVRAIGPRAILDFRDEFHLPVCPVKATTEKTQLITNIGNCKAKFKLDTQSPFSVTPSCGTLDVGENMQVTVDFNPMTVGVHSQELLLHYHTGEDVYIELHGTCEELKIQLEAETVLLNRTYVSFASVCTVSLTYKSEIPLKYYWTTWPSLQEEALSLLRETSELPLKELEGQREQLLVQCESDPGAIHRLPLLSRALQERRSQAVKDYRLALSHSCTTVEPAEGEIWPKCPGQFNIVFKPEEAKLYQQTIYCDITGREARLPLTIKAEGVGPNLYLIYELIDMQNVFIGEKDFYEVQFDNKGLIDAPFRLSSPDTTFGRCFSFSPEEGVVSPGACQIVKVTFHSRILGTFSEDLLLTVTGQPEPLTVTFRGCVIGPTFHFNISQLNFGDVAFGFPVTLTCTLHNTSYVSMTFALHVLGDGFGSPSITSDEQASEMSRNNWAGSAAGDLRAQPTEFTITPTTCSLQPLTNVTIKVTLCSNTVKRYMLALVVDVEGVGEEIMTLPIIARCIVPNIVVETPELDFQRCFLDHPYAHRVLLTNTSALPACIGMLDQEYEESPSLIFCSSSPRGLILPHSSGELHVFLMAKAVGIHRHTLRIAVFGSVQPPLEVVLSCIGQGPVVHVQSSRIDFGTIPVLTDVTRTLHLSNQSPIPAHFTACMSHGMSFGQVEPSEGEVPPESQLELRVVAHLKDTLHFQVRLEVSIRDSHDHTVLLSATGTGTTIVSDRPFAPNLDLGACLSQESCHYHFKLTNQGQRTYRMYWRTDGFLASGKIPKRGSFSCQPVLPPISAPKKKGILNRGALPSSSEVKPVFNLKPSRVELTPGGSVDMVLTGSSDSPKVVQERLLCHAIVGGQGCSELIMSVDVTCRFVAPMLNISSRQLKFYLEKVPGKSLKPLYEKLILENVSSLSLTVELSLVEPFSLCQASGAHSPVTTKSMVLGDGKQSELWVCFNPGYCQDQVSQIVDKVLEIHYQGHPQRDTVELHAEVHFPNLHLSTTAVDFGCVPNCTGTRRAISITNCSPLPVSYHWVFLADQEHSAIRETAMLEAEREPTNETKEEGWRSSRMPSPAFSAPFSPVLGADELSSAEVPVSVQEVFDILPIHGHLKPGEQQQVTLSFYGHENVSREVVAQCRVEEGPAYEIQLRGEASVVSYSLNSMPIDFGPQLFDHEGEAEVTLRNTGKMGFEFNILYPQNEDDEAGGERKTPEELQNENGQEVVPGRPMVIPATGFIDPGAEQCLRVLYLPGLPEVFEKQLQLQVAYLPLQVITLTGEGVFPRISLDLPQNLKECYGDAVQQARTALEEEELKNGTTIDGGATTEANRTLTYEELLCMEVERTLVKQFALAVLESRDSQGSSRKWNKLSQLLLPEYVLDFGFVIPGKVLSHTVNVSNTGSVPVSFQAHVKPLAGTGFSTDMERVKNLPCGVTKSFTIKFVPQSEMGDTSVVMPIQVAGGPMVQVRLCAVVTVPAVIVSTDALQFDTLPCGMCQMRTIQLFNPESVPCYWSIAEKGNPLKKRTKDLEKQRPTHVEFKCIPSSGMLSPGDRVNVQIRFSPAEGHLYNRQLLVRVADSSQQVIITVQGWGEEPHLEFDTPVLELGPSQPASIDVEGEVTVKNQCSFPIEFYSLDFDTQYLEEEKILRLMQDYDKNNILLLPPRAPGESLPAELHDYYQEYCSQLKDDAELKDGLEEGEAATGDTYEKGERSRPNVANLPDSKVEDMHTVSVKPAELLVSEMTKEGLFGGQGQHDMTPVSRAIARHTCVDLTNEGQAACNRRGIAIIVYGAPLTDKGSTVTALARHYGAACVRVNAVVTEVLLNGTSPVGLTAKKLYDDAAADYAKKKSEEAAQTTEPGLAADQEASEPAAQSAHASRDTLEASSKSSEDSDSGNDSKSVPETHLALGLGGDVTTLSNLLPEQLLVDILAERFQLSDCHRGIVIDGLESVFSHSAAGMLQIVLKALNNRKHIFVIALSDSYTALKAREKAQSEAEEVQQKEKADREEQWLQELDEEEYDALPEVEQKRIFQQMREKRKQQNLRELERVEQEKMRLQEEMNRLREEDLKRKSRGAKKDIKDTFRKKSVMDGKQSADGFNGRRMSFFVSSREPLMDAREMPMLNEGAGSPQPSDQLEREKSIETAEIKRLREEKELKKSKKGGERDNKEAPVKRATSGGKEATATDAGPMSVSNNTKESQVDVKEQQNVNEDASRMYQNKEADYSQKKPKEAKGLQTESSRPANKMEAIVDELQSQFTAYEHSQELVEHILQHWDRVRGLMLVPLPSEDAPPVSEDALTEKQTVSSKRSKKASCKIMSPMPSQMGAPADGGLGLSHEIIPHIVLNITGKDYPSASELLRGSTLPSLVEVLDDLGLGPSGPPIPPPTTFSLVPFPQNRQQSNNQLTSGCFTFLVPSGMDEHDMEKSDLMEDARALALKEEAAATVSKGRNVKESAATKDKSRESQKSKRQTSARKKGSFSERSRSHRHASSTYDSTEQNQHQENLELKRSQSLTTYRWVVPANGEVNLKVWFYSDSPGKFEQTFNFELLGTQRQYQLLCRGVSTYPAICKGYMTLFAHSKKVQQMNEGLQKTYVIKPGYFEFGPLLCGKTRDRYKENKYPENMERLVIHNDSGLEAEVQFHFQHDSHAATYLLDPPTMTLKPDQKQELTVWAYPTQLGQMKDSIVCQIKDNPEPVIINLSCWGVRPELKLESKHFHFKRTLLDRQDSRSLMLHNKMALPVSWRLQGVEELGDEFSVPQDEGIMSPNSSFPLTLHFRPKRPLNIKKILHLEVSDVEMILGIVHTENILVIAEAFDIVLNITPDGCLDFGTIKVFEEAKLSLKMKNQGKYELAFKFALQQTDPNQPNLDSIFTVSPMSGTLMPHEKPTTVQILCRPKTEIFMREQAILPCQVIEPSIGNGGEPVAILANKVSVKSVFSRYKITPACDMNFGPMIYGCKKSQSFTIENNGDFETRFTICCMVTDPAPSGKAGCPCRKMSHESHSEKLTGANTKMRRKSSVHKDMSVPQVCLQNRITVGVFSLSPCNGNLQPGFQQVVTVDCAAEQLGSWKQGLLIDISHRDPSDQPDGIPYRLLAEICKPCIALDTASIFEEHHICHNSSQLSSEQFCNAESIYVRDQNQFIFNKVLVGRTAQARFKLTNNNKVFCVLSMAIKYVGAKIAHGAEVFDLSATTLNIPSQSYSFAVVTFTPQAVQLYSAVFEVTLEVTSRMTPTFKSKVLEFNLIGEGNLPSIRVMRPALRNSRGSPMLQFTQVLVGRRQTRPVVLLNDGKVPAKVQIDMLDKHGVFTIEAAPGHTCSSVHSTQIEGPNESAPSCTEHHTVHRALLKLDVNEQVEVKVSFCSDKPTSVKAKMTMQVEDNQYDNTQIQVIGKTYKKVVFLDNIRQSLQEIDQEDEERGNVVLNFGECHVDCPSQESFTMINHSSDQVVRFEWPPDGSHVFFSPQVGHLHAGCSKEVTVTFDSNQPVTLTSQPITCKVSQVEFQQPLEQVADWDDRQRTVQWLNAYKQATEAPQQPVENKADPEPCCSVVEGSQWDLELRISAVCDYVKFSCDTDTIHFKDTLLYQTRLHQLRIVNHATVKLEYSWQVLMDQMNNSVNHEQRDETQTSRRGSRSADVLTQSRHASTLPSVMSLLTANSELPPFSVEPSIGAVAPGATQDFRIRFSPREVAQFQGRLVSSIPNLRDGDQAPCVSVCARSKLPHCHFDLEVSDYISGNRRNPDFKTPVDPDTRVIEFNSVSTSVPSTRCFSVVNPTNKPYSFKWRCEDTDAGPFCCLKPRGTILPRSRADVCFEYISEQLVTAESFWSFTIETLSLTFPFLCVGTTREPLVYLDRPHLNLGELLIGRKVEQTVYLVNGEEKPYCFSVVQSSLLCDDQKSSLILQPMAGRLAPRDRLPLSLSFMPCREGYVSSRLVLRVTKKSEQLTLTVKADCFSMSTSIQVQKPEGGLREIGPNHTDTLDFGKLWISEQSTVNLLVSNLARFRLEVNFDLTGPSELLQYVEAKPQYETIDVGKQLPFSLFFCPRSICNLQDVQLSIKVKHGPTFTFAIEGAAVESSLEFSFIKHNFGKCFVYSPGMVPACQTLVITNKGERHISVECQFQNTSYLEMDFQPNILSPGDVMKALLTFYPHEACCYHERLTFVFNSCVKRTVDVLGQGIETKLEVENPKQRRVNLGSLMLGEEVKKQVVLVNRSPLDLSFTLLLNTNPPLAARDLSVSPAGELNLQASVGSCSVEIQFSPCQQIPPFTAELQAEFAGLLHPLLTIHGCCQSVDVQLDQVYLAFGAVVQRCQARKRIVMQNSGDIGARFEWKTENFPPELSITPVNGYICPGMNVPFQVTFAPVELINDSRYENLPCYVEGSFFPVNLTVTGSCIVAPTSKEVLNFVCPVRGSHTQTLSVFNPTNQRCSIRPIIEGEQWSTEGSVIFEPLQNKICKIIYRPLSTTTDGKKHLGSIFFSFPDGTGMLYSLLGTAEPPKAKDVILHEMPAKTLHSELLPVHNWLSKPQRFHVLMEILKPDKPDATISLKGLEYFDVPALVSRDYSMSFFTYKEGIYNIKVTFRNEESGEYLFYLITFKATSPGVLSTIELVTPVHRTTSATVQVENPLNIHSCLSTECKCLEISAPPQHTVPGKSKSSMSFEYQPLRAGESTVRLTLHSQELGFFHYDLLLKALPPPPEKTVHFNTSLGCSQSVFVKFTNHARFKSEYSGKTDCSDFTVSKAKPQVGSELSMEVSFEPHQLGEVTGQLSVSSANGGDYIFPLNGICLPPKAQGPLSIRAGRNVSIPFKNVLLQATTFSYKVDNPCFTVKEMDTINSKKTQHILVSLEAPSGGSPGPWFGKLTISNQRSEVHSKSYSWVYYLRGHRSDT